MRARPRRVIAHGRADHSGDLLEIHEMAAARDSKVELVPYVVDRAFERWLAASGNDAAGRGQGR